MKIKLIDARDLNLLYDGIKSAEMPISLAYKFNKLMNSVDKELDFFQEKLNAILEKYAERDEQGNYVQLTPNNIKIQEDKMDECQKELNELQSFEVEIPEIKFSLEELDCLEVTPQQLKSLMSFIED